jgi:hypothetical protein
MLNEYVNANALNLNTKYVKPSTSSFIKKQALSYVPKTTPIAKPVVARTGLAGLYDTVAGFGGKLSAGAGLLFAPTDAGSGSDIPVSTGYWNETNTTPQPVVPKRNTVVSTVAPKVAVNNTATPKSALQSTKKQPSGMLPPPALVPVKSSVANYQAGEYNQPMNTTALESWGDDMQSPDVIPQSVVAPAVVQSPMDVAKFNAEQSNLLADKNIAAQKQIAEMGQKSDWEKYGSIASGVGSALGGVAGLYGAYMNAKYQKDQANMQKNMIRGDEANKSAFAKAAGGTYQRSGV